MNLDHFTMRMRDIEAARDFFASVFGMSPGERCELIRRFLGCWLYSDGQPLVHIVGSLGNDADHSAKALDHIGTRRDPDQLARINPARLAPATTFIPVTRAIGRCRRHRSRCAAWTLPHPPHIERNIPWNIALLENLVSKCRS